MSYQWTEAAFWARVNKSDGCWLWTGAKTNAGYGITRRSGRTELVHRTSLMLSGVGIPGDMVVRHHCDTPLCVRPDHLAVGTHKDNTQDMMARGRNRHGEVLGEKHPCHRLAAADVALMKLLRECGVKLSSLAGLFGVSQARVSQICLGQAWKHIAALEAPCAG